MLGSSRRDLWGAEGLDAVSKSFHLYNAIIKLVSDKAECSLVTVKEYIPKFDAIDAARFAYSAKWADEASGVALVRDEIERKINQLLVELKVI